VRRLTLFLLSCLAWAVLPARIQAVLLILSLLAAPVLFYVRSPSSLLHRKDARTDFLIAAGFLLISISALSISVGPQFTMTPSDGAGVPVLDDDSINTVAHEHLTLATPRIAVTLAHESRTVLVGADPLWLLQNTLRLHRDLLLIICLTIATLLLSLAAWRMHDTTALLLLPVLYAAAYTLLVPAIIVYLIVYWRDPFLQPRTKRLWPLALAGLLLARWTTSIAKLPSLAITLSPLDLRPLLSLPTLIATLILVGVAWHVWYRLWLLRTTLDRKHLPDWPPWTLAITFIALGILLAAWRGWSMPGIAAGMLVIAAGLSLSDAMRRALMLLPMLVAMLALGLFVYTTTVATVTANIQDLLLVLEPTGSIAVAAIIVLGLAHLFAIIAGYLSLWYEATRP
jgi:hypothetical protein